MTDMLFSDRLRLEPFAEKHLTETYVSWLNDPEVTRFSEQRFRIHTLQSCREYASAVAASADELWAIVIDADARHIGNIVAHIDMNHRVTDIGIMVGERPVWGQGFGYEAWDRVVSHLLQERAMRKVTAGTLACNKAMLSIMQRSGMVEEGRRIRQQIVDGKEVDVIYFGRFA